MVVTYDYRGIGGSAPSRLRGFEARMRDWAFLDMTAVVDCPPRHGMGANEIRAVAQAGPFAYFGTQGCGVAVLADSLQYAADAASN